MPSLLQDPLLDWMLLRGHQISEPLELVAQLGEGLVTSMPGFLRLTILQGAHAMDIGAMVWIWTRDGTKHQATSSNIRSRSMFQRGGQTIEEVMLAREHFREPLYLESPFCTVMDGADEVRRRLCDADGPLDYPVLDDLRSEGATDYLVLPLETSDGRVHAVSMVTDAKGGFSVADVRRLRVVCVLLAVAIERIGARREMVLDRRLMDMRVDFMTTLAHEFRTPLSTIMLAVDSLISYGEGMGPEQYMARLQNIATQGTRLRGLLNEVTEFADGSHKRRPLRPIEVDLERFTQDCLKSQKQLDGGRHEVSVSFEGPPSEVRLDLGAWRALIDILIDNAVKFSPEGGGIHVSAKVTDDALILVVKDSGIGIPEIDLPHIPSPFFRATNVGVIGGMGLGLSILNARLTRNGGRLALSSVEGEGTEAMALLPRHLFEH